MSDEKLRALERAAAAGDAAARERYLREKTRVGQPIYMADVLEEAGFKKVALSSVAAGVRAVCKLAHVDALVSIWRDSCASYVYTETSCRASDSGAAFEQARERFRKTFEISMGPLYHTHREERRREYDLSHAAGPTLKPEHQEAFLEAVSKNEGKAPSLKPVGRAFQVNDVVTLKLPGAYRRFVVCCVEKDGRLELVALSGSFRKGVIGRISQESVAIAAASQDIFFAGADSGKLARHYEGRLHSNAQGQPYRGQR